MPDDRIKISALPSALSLDNTDVLAIVQGMTGDSKATKKAAVTLIAAHLLEVMQHNNLDTSDKTIIGAINEVAETLEGLYPVADASGPIANFSTELARPLEALKVGIAATQEAGTPTPAAPLPISGWIEISVAHCGSNLWDEDWELGIWNSSGVKSDSQNAIRCKNYIKIKPSETYYVFANFTRYATGVILRLLDANKSLVRTVVVNSSSTKTFTADSNVEYVVWCSSTADQITTYSNDVSINYPSSDTTYHTYNGNTEVINLGGTYYGGHFTQDKDGDRQFDDTYSGLVNLSDLTFYPTTKGGHTCFYADLSNGIIKSGGEQAFLGKCSTYTVTSNLNLPNDLSCLFYCSELYGGYTRVMIRDDSASSMTGVQFTAYVTGQITYEKANPQTIALPDGQPIITLNGTNNIYADSGDILECKYKDTIQHYIDTQIAATQALIL